MTVSWARTAVEDLRHLEGYIAADSPFYARRLVDKILEASGQLHAFPRSGRKVPEADREEIRELIVQGYRIIYRVTPSEVQILTVVHGSRDLGARAAKPWDAA